MRISYGGKKKYPPFESILLMESRLVFDKKKRERREKERNKKERKTLINKLNNVVSD